MLQTLFNYLVQAVLEQRQLPPSPRRVYSILPHLMNKGKWSGASPPIENRPVARVIRLWRNSAATFARVTEHFFSTQKPLSPFQSSEGGFDSTLFRLRQTHEGSYLSRGPTAPGLFLLIFREAGQHGGLVVQEHLVASGHFVHGLAGRYFPQTLAKVANSPGNDAIPGRQKHFWPEICRQTFARVPGLSFQIIRLEPLLHRRVYFTHDERFVVGGDREILSHKCTIHQGAPPPFHPFQVVAVRPLTWMRYQPRPDRVQV